MTQPAIAPWGDERRPRPVVSERTVFHGHIFDLVTREVDLGEAGVVSRDLLHHPGAVAIVALDECDRVLLLRQYRVPVASFLWEVPAGLLDGGESETMLVAAQRELAEEADLVAERWDVLVDYATTPGASSEAIRIFLARDLRPAPHSGFVREGEEAEIVTTWVDLAEAATAVLTGRVHNPSTVVGILAALRAREDGFSSLRAVTEPHLLRPDVTPA